MTRPQQTPTPAPLSGRADRRVSFVDVVTSYRYDCPLCGVTEIRHDEPRDGEIVTCGACEKQFVVLLMS